MMKKHFQINYENLPATILGRKFFLTLSPLELKALCLSRQLPTSMDLKSINNDNVKIWS